MSQIETHFHNKNLLSLKDYNSSIDIGDCKWDKLFSKLLRLDFIYFYGNRNIYLDNELLKNINFHAENIICASSDYFSILLKTNSNLLISRKSISEIWNSYEFPCFIFSEQLIDLFILKEQFKRGINYSILLKTFPSILILYKNIEFDVLWLSVGNSAKLQIDNLLSF